MDLETAIKELFFWQTGKRQGDEPDNFTAMIFCLMHKADLGNRERLRAGFPSEVAAWEMWQASPSETEFFKEWGLM